MTNDSRAANRDAIAPVGTRPPAETPVRAISLDDLRALTASGHGREATAADAIDDVQPRFVIEPGSIEEAAAVLKLANETGLAVAPRGAGTKRRWGNPPRRLDIVLSTTRLNRLLEHAAGDLVVRVEAGVRLSDLQEALSGAGQWLALDPPEAGATIGGIIATNASGRHRLRYGAVRDLLIGITYVLPDGTIAHAGSKVVKNVAGYDLSKLFAGSLGTLGLVVEAIFRLHPLPSATRTVLCTIREGAVDSIGKAVQAVLHSTLVPHALDVHSGSRAVTLVLLFEGVEPGVAAQAEEARALLRHTGDVRILKPEEEREFEQRRQTMAVSRAEGTSVLKISTVPADLAQTFSDVLAASRAGAVGCRVTGHAGNGILYVDISGEPPAQAASILALREGIRQRGGHLVIQDAPLAVREIVDPWGDVGNALALMRRMKELFDPHATMNPGRYVGRL